jgi:uncharacterized protein (DUF1697 family)
MEYIAFLRGINVGGHTVRIEERLQKALGFSVPVFLRTVPEVERILASDPFRTIEKKPDTGFCVVFGAKPMPRSLPLPLYSPKKDAMIAGITQAEAVVVWYIVNGRPPAADKFLEKTLGQATTSRFYHTLTKIAEAAKNKR